MTIPTYVETQNKGQAFYCIFVFKKKLNAFPTNEIYIIYMITNYKLQTTKLSYI